MSERWSTRAPWACSGEPYPIEPYGTPTSVADSSVRWAGSRPSSGPASWPAEVEHLACPPGCTTMFDGLTSRWTMPREWATARPSAIWIAIESALGRSSGRPCMSCRSVGPSTYCITM
jgi:hypothetical protein